MTDTDFFEQEHRDGLISDMSFQKIKNKEQQPLFSVHWEVKTMLYAGVLLFTTGLGTIIYKNIDSIGHQVILFLIAAVCAGSYWYCYSRKAPYTNNKVDSNGPAFDYLLLLASLTLIIFVAYMQFQYGVFGQQYGLATCIPMLILFFTAYYFDHLGILSLGITNLATWLGISVTPTSLLKANDFNSESLLLTGLLLGLLLIMFGILSKTKDIKAHFSAVYTNFGIHIIFISCLAAMFYYGNMYHSHYEEKSTVHVLLFYIMALILLVGIAYYFFRRASRERSFYYLLVTTLYGYIGISYVFIVSFAPGLDVITIVPLYFIISGILLVRFLMMYNQKLKGNDHI